MSSKLWISLLKVRALPESDYADFEEAFVNGITLAKSVEEAHISFELALKELGLKLISTEDTEEFKKRVANFEVAAELKELARIAQKTGETQFGTFHTWEENKE